MNSKVAVVMGLALAAVLAGCAHQTNIVTTKKLVRRWKTTRSARKKFVRRSEISTALCSNLI